MRSLKISAVLIAILALIAVLAAPASAAKPKPKPTEPAYPCETGKGCGPAAVSPSKHKHRCKHGRHHKCGHKRRIIKDPGPDGIVTKDPGPDVIVPWPECLYTPAGCNPVVIPDPPPCCIHAEEPFEATEMKMRLFVDETVTPATESTWGCAKLQLPSRGNVTIRFLAYYGSFQSSVWGGYKGPAAAPIYCSEYIPPPHPEYVQCSADIPRVIDTAWAVVLDRATHTFVESERVKFYIDNPEEEVGDVHCPVG